MLPDIQPGNTKILYFFNCLLDGMHTILFTESVSFACANQKSSCLYSGVLLSFKVQIQERYGEHYDKIRMPRWHER
jgi:hypothetical protein